MFVLCSRNRTTPFKKDVLCTSVCTFFYKKLKLIFLLDTHKYSVEEERKWFILFVWYGRKHCT